ncbi:MAG: HEAT repeat domain-containing protein [Planctomycetes bacterium]|nr:HEAT repeat domain-containing protein [Planctomycetota bacterium]
MRRLIPSLVTLGILVPLGAMADETDREELQKILETVWKARKSEILAGEPVPARSVPSTDPAGQRVCPLHRVTLLEFVIEKETRQEEPDAPLVVVGQTTAYFCRPGPEMYVKRESEGTETVWLGPVRDPAFPIAEEKPIEIPGGTDTDPKPDAATREAVEKALQKHMTDSGDQGFFEGRFADLKEIPGAMDALFDIFETTTDRQMRHLAIEALGEIADKSGADRMRRIANDSKYENHRMQAGVALYRMGDDSVVQSDIDQMKMALERTPDAAQQSQIHGTLGLYHSLIKKEDEALVHYQKSVELDTTNQMAHYNLACSYSKLGRVDDALHSLEDAAKNGYADWEWMMIDGDLKAVRDDPRFKEIYLKYRK